MLKVLLFEYSVEQHAHTRNIQANSLFSFFFGGGLVANYNSYPHTASRLINEVRYRMILLKL